MNQKIGRSERDSGTTDAAAILSRNDTGIGEVLDAGPVLYLYSRTQEMRAKLQLGFRDSWSTLYAMALMRAVYNCPLAEMEHCYRRSILRVLFPNISLSKQNMTHLFQGGMYYNSECSQKRFCPCGTRVSGQGLYRFPNRISRR